MARDPATMSDDALRRACRPAAWESVLERSGVALPIAVGVATGAGVAHGVPVDSFEATLLGSTLAGLTGAAFAAVGRNGLTGARRSGYRAELRRRYGLDDLRATMEGIADAMRRNNAPAWVLLLDAQGLPQGDHVRIRVDAGEPPNLDARWIRGPSRAIEQAELVRVERRFTAPDLAEVLPIGEHLGPRDFPDVPSTVRDGVACRLGIVRRDPSLRHVATCNLLGVPEDQVASLTVRLARALHAAAQPRRSSP